MTAATLTTLPIELVADILSFLDLYSILQASQSCKLFAAVCCNGLLDPWRDRIQIVLRNQASASEDERRLLTHLGCYLNIPRQNWVNILSLARPDVLLFSELPWLPEDIWQQAFMKRFLPSWTRWKKSQTWKRTFLSLLWRIHHRLSVTCTAEESWTSFLMLSRQGIVNLSSASSRQYNPHAVLNVYKEQNNLAKQPSATRIIVQLADVRIIAMGTPGSRSSFQVNRLAKEFMHPAGVYPKGITPLLYAQDEPHEPVSASSESASYLPPRNIGTPITRSMTMDPTPPPHPSIWKRIHSRTFSSKETPHYIDTPAPPLYSPPRANINLALAPPMRYAPLTHPRPIEAHREFPNYTPGGQDLRWPEGYDGTSEEIWVGPLLITALLVPQDDVISEDGADEIMNRMGAGRNRWASFTADDLDAIAPWLQNHIEKRMEGMGLGTVINS